MIQLITVDLGARKVQIPVAEIVGSKHGKTLLVTGGMDGDEYAGIEAAYKIIEEYTLRNFNGRLIIIPIINIPAFEARTSANPLDGKYPKCVYPGSLNGSPTERLIHWLNINYISQCNVWIDLHSGALHELLTSYIYLYETRDIRLKILIPYIRQLDSLKLVVEKPGSWKKAELIGKRGIAYLFAEAGCSGKRDRASINKHIDWVKTVMGVLGIIQVKKKRKTTPRIYRKTRSYQASDNGLWYPSVQPTSKVAKGQKLGELRYGDGKLIKPYFSEEDGEYLWGYEALAANKGETLIEIGIEQITLTQLTVQI